jgi:hypothetical protein
MSPRVRIAGQDYAVRLNGLLTKMEVTLDQMYDIGWKDQSLIEAGHANWITSKPAPQPCLLCEGSGYAGEISEVTRQLIERDRHGREKYGQTLDRTDLKLADWLQHQAEELMDGAGYALAAKREAEKLMEVLLLAGALCEQISGAEASRMGHSARDILFKLSDLVGVKRT